MTRLIHSTRLAAAVAFGSTLIVPPAFAQDAAPPPPAGAEAPAAAQTADPPARAGRIAQINGTVSFHGPGADQWEAATLNFPLTDGDALWTEPQAGAAMEVSGGRITLAGSTELDVTKLDAQTLTLTEPQGEAYLRLTHLAPGETYTVLTPRGTVTIMAAGRYEIAAGDQASPTRVTVIEGQAQVSGDNLALAVGPGQTASVTGDQTFQGTVGQVQGDAFLATMEQQAAPPVPVAQSAPAPQAVEAMPGAEDLNQYGAWQPTPDYGTVWYPQVEAGWVPYRHGHWAYVGPWGWTWIDDAPWGFAPFHYGRWVEIDNRWAWAPVYHAPGWVAPAAYIEAPVYAPALVSFVGIGVGVGVGVGIGVGFGFGVGFGGSIGWCPLGWGEPFRPWYHTSPGYFENVNRTYVHNVTNITRINNTNITINNFANRRAATVVPAATLTGSRPVAQAARPLTAQQMANLRPASTMQVRPTAATAGVTPTVARQFGLHPTAATARPATPGPHITPATATQPVRPTLPAATPHVGAPTPAATGVHPAAPNAAAVHPAAPNAPAAHSGAPGPAITPHTAGTAPAAPTLRPAAPAAGATHPGQPQVTHGGAPGPAITPHASGTAPTPALRPVAPTTAAPSHPGTAGAPAPHAASPSTPTPQVQHPAPQSQVQHVAPQPQVQHATPQPQVQHPAPAVQHPMPQVVHPTPAPQHVAPAPHVSAPQPQQHFSAPAPQHFAAPAQHQAPAPQHQAPAPQHQAPAPQHHSCAPGQKNC